MSANRRIAYYNGQYLPEEEIRIPFRDKSFLYGDGCFDVTRTFNGKPFKVAEHMARFYRSLAYLRIDIGHTAEELTAVTLEVLERNRHLLSEGEDYWLGQRVSRGISAVGDEGWEDTGPTVIVDCRPLPFKERAKCYRDGIKVIVPSVRRTPPESLSPRTKTHNYLNMIMANLEVQAQDPEAWAVLLDHGGNLAEGQGSNLFLVKDGVLLTPEERFVLAGVSRQTVMELAAGLGLEVVERGLDLYDAYTADECFLTSTSLCLCPVASVNGRAMGDGRVPGPLTQQLLGAYSELVDCDIVAQYLRHLA
jgi:branched-chain amino acid aminotransferase